MTPPAECYVRSRGTLEQMSGSDVVRPASMETYAWSRGDDPLEKAIAGRMAEGIGKGQSDGIGKYLSAVGVGVLIREER